jgi:transposase-like protein
MARSHEAVWLWYHRFAGLADVLHIGYAKTAVVDERYVNVKGFGAWIWMAYEPHSRRLLALHATWHRNDLAAYLFLQWLKERYRVRYIITDGAHWYRYASSQLNLHHQVDGALCNYVERLSKEVKRRLADFDLYFPCRCRKPFTHVNRWLEAWRIHYNHVRHHMALGRPPCGISDNPTQLIKLIQEPK